MKKAFLTMLLSASLLAFSGCSSHEKGYDDVSKPEEIALSMAEGYTLLAKCSDITPFGIVPLEDSVVICDMENNCLREFDFQGKEIRKVGQSGNGHGEFLRPSGLAYCGETFYVVDSGNSRVQILDKNFDYQSEYALDALEQSDPDSYYTDIAVSGDGTATVLTNSLFKEKARVYLLDSGGSVQKTPHILYGYANCEKDRIYYVNTYQLFESDSALTGVTQESYLYELVDGGLSAIFQFPYKYGPTDFIVDGDDVYVLSAVWGQLDHFKTNGAYVETIWDFGELSLESCLARTPQGGFVVTDRQNKAAYFLSHGGD